MQDFWKNPDGNYFISYFIFGTNHLPINLTNFGAQVSQATYEEPVRTYISLQNKLIEKWTKVSRRICQRIVNVIFSFLVIDSYNFAGGGLTHLCNLCVDKTPFSDISSKGYGSKQNWKPNTTPPCISYTAPNMLTGANRICFAQCLNKGLSQSSIVPRISTAESRKISNKNYLRPPIKHLLYFNT